MFVFNKSMDGFIIHLLPKTKTKTKISYIKDYYYPSHTSIILYSLALFIPIPIPILKIFYVNYKKYFLLDVSISISIYDFDFYLCLCL